MDNQSEHLSLKNLMIAAPCDVRWDEMEGNSTVRRCGECHLNVINISNLTGKEAETLLKRESDKCETMCVQFYRRSDGTILTKDCPQGLAKVRAFSSRIYRSAAALLALFLVGSPMLAHDKNDSKSPKTKNARTTPPPIPLGGAICPPKQPVKSIAPAGSPEKDGASGQTNQESHNSRAHVSAFNLYREGQQLEKSKDFAKAADAYQQALTTMSKSEVKHDPKFHLKIETALSRAKAKAGINQ